MCVRERGPTIGIRAAWASAARRRSQARETWTALAASGPLVLGQSEEQFAVYDQQRTYGRWPKTDQGYRFASEAYAAHSQSLLHGLAYTSAGYQDPDRLGLPPSPVARLSSAIRASRSALCFACLLASPWTAASSSS